MVVEDDVDPESLQAQLDTTMSFAHSLVMSWIKPSHRPSVTVTQVLEDELRRPPRLGVGASIPTTSPLIHEASRLRRRLGKNGAKTESAVEPRLQESDDEEEKGRPTKRKSNADPFEHKGSKKKKKDVELHSIPCPTVRYTSVSLLKNSTLGDLPKHNSPSVDQQSHTTEGQRSTTLVPSSSTRETSVPDPVKSITPTFSRVHTNFVPIPDKAKLLGIPLLNLDGPPEFVGKPGNPSELNSSRKKRKRRKKRKNQETTGTGDSSR